MKEVIYNKARPRLPSLSLSSAAAGWATCKQHCELPPKQYITSNSLNNHLQWLQRVSLTYIRNIIKKIIIKFIVICQHLIVYICTELYTLYIYIYIYIYIIIKLILKVDYIFHKSQTDQCSVSHPREKSLKILLSPRAVKVVERA